MILIYVRISFWRFASWQVRVPGIMFSDCWKLIPMHPCRISCAVASLCLHLLRALVPEAEIWSLSFWKLRALAPKAQGFSFEWLEFRNLRPDGLSSESWVWWLSFQELRALAPKAQGFRSESWGLELRKLKSDGFTLNAHGFSSESWRP